jgi:predicted RNase H-like nuclease (RuvC/YqgF family)
MEMVSVGIKRNPSHTIQRECPDYEIPVLQELFGDTAVLIGERKPVPKEDLPDVQKAYDRLQARYNTNDGSKALESVYRNFDEFKRSYRRVN